MKTRILLMLVSLSTAGCAAQARSPEPVPVDRAECARCRMLISTEAGAGEIVTAHEDTRFYDDVGCLAADWKAHAREATAFVRVESGGWVDARQAWFAHPERARTAMASGLLAYATADAAKQADRGGRALGWDEVVADAGERR